MSKSTLNCAAAIFNIRRTLQDYKNGKPPECQIYGVSAHDLLDMLDMTMQAWCALESVEQETRQLISGLLDAVKNNG